MLEIASGGDISIGKCYVATNYNRSTWYLRQRIGARTGTYQLLRHLPFLSDVVGMILQRPQDPDQSIMVVARTFSTGRYGLSDRQYPCLLRPSVQILLMHTPQLTTLEQ